MRAHAKRRPRQENGFSRTGKVGQRHLFLVPTLSGAFFAGFNFVLALLISFTLHQDFLLLSHHSLFLTSQSVNPFLQFSQNSITADLAQATDK